MPCSVPAVSETIDVEVVFALPDRQRLVPLTVTKGTTVDAAIAASGIADSFPDVEFEKLATGIWGRPVSRQHTLQQGDRVEVYRDLLMDPREARRIRASD